MTADNFTRAESDTYLANIVKQAGGTGNVDAQLMKNGSASLSRIDERLAKMQNE